MLKGLPNAVRFIRPAQGPAKFKIGDRVRTKNIHPKTHTRLPRYARGHVGVVERLHGTHSFSRFGSGRQRRRSAMALHGALRRADLWGADADPTLKVSIEAFEPYLEHV